MKIFQAFGGKRREIVQTAVPLDPGVELLDGTPRKHSWTPFRVKIIKEDEHHRRFARSLCPSICMSHALVLREEAALRLEPFLATIGELLPLECEEPLCVWHPLRVIDAVDLSRSDVSRFNDGRLMYIRRYEFLPEKIRAADAFKIPGLNICPIFYSEHAMEKISGVLGDDLQFKLLWTDERKAERGAPIMDSRASPHGTPSASPSCGSLLNLGKRALGFVDKKKIEDQMAEWLSHTLEFGVAPKMIRYRKTEKAKLVTHGKIRIHVVDYEMPGGKKGRGFVNDSLTWSFLGDEVNAISDGDHFTAYCGWAWLFPAIQAGTVKTDFVSDHEEGEFTDSRRSSGVENLRITGRYRIGTSELFEFEGTRNGTKVKGAGGAGDGVEFGSSDPRYCLPAIYFLLGEEVILNR
jgi:hypothetical protein